MFTFSPINGMAIYPLVPFPEMHLLDSESGYAVVS